MDLEQRMKIMQEEAEARIRAQEAAVKARKERLIWEERVRENNERQRMTDEEMNEQMKGHHGQITACCFSADGSRLFTSSLEGDVCVWDNEGNLLQTWSCHQGPINALVYPSARSDVAVSIHEGELASLRGWNLLDYRATADIASTELVTDEDPWHDFD